MEVAYPLPVQAEQVAGVVGRERATFQCAPWLTLTRENVEDHERLCDLRVSSEAKLCEAPRRRARIEIEKLESRKFVSMSREQNQLTLSIFVLRRARIGTRLQSQIGEIMKSNKSNVIEFDRGVETPWHMIDARTEMGEESRDQDEGSFWTLHVGRVSGDDDYKPGWYAVAYGGEFEPDLDAEDSEEPTATWSDCEGPFLTRSDVAKAAKNWSRRLRRKRVGRSSARGGTD